MGVVIPGDTVTQVPLGDAKYTVSQDKVSLETQAASF